MLGEVCFTSRTIRKSKVVGYYYRFLLYAILAKKRHKTKTYGGGVMQVPVGTFRRLASELPEKVMDYDGVAHMD